MKDNISSYQWMAMLSAPVSAVLMINYIKLYVTATGRGSYVAAIIVSILTFVLLAVGIFLQNKNEYRTISRTASFLFGRRLGPIFCFFVALFFFLFTVEALNTYVYIVKFYFLPKTPELILTFVLFLPAAYMAYCGFRSFAYMAAASLFAFVLFLLLFLFTKNNYLVANVLPLNDFCRKDIFTSLPMLFLSAPAVAASFAALPLCGDRRRLYRKAAVFSAALCVLMIFLYAAGMMYFGEEIIQKLVLPFYNLSPFFKGNLLERFDIFFMLALLPIVTIYSAFGFSVFTVIQQDLLPGLNARRRKGLMTVYSVGIVLLSALTVNRLPLWKIYRSFNAAFLVLVGVLFLLYAAAYLKRRRTRP